MRFLIKLGLSSAAFCGPYFAGLSMRNPFPMMMLAWILLGISIWVWMVTGRKRKRWER